MFPVVLTMDAMALENSRNNWTVDETKTLIAIWGHTDIQNSLDVKIQNTVIKEQQAEIEVLNQQKYIDDDKEKRFVMDTEGPLAFSAVINPQVVAHTHSNQVIAFETMLTNCGRGYNNNTEIFVVPLAGIYLITRSILDHTRTGGHGGVMVHGEIMRNHEILARVFAHAEDTLYRDQGANTSIVQLNVGDQVFVRTVDQNDLGLGGERYTSFSGYLLWQT